MTPRSARNRPAAVVTTGDNAWTEHALRYAALLSLYAVFLVIVLCSWLVPAGNGIAPFWALIPIFAWSVRRPEFLPGGMVFIIGLLTDIVIGTPLGAHALALLTVAALARLQQRYLMTQNFVAIWADFAALSLLFSFLVTLVTVLSLGTGNALGSVLMASAASWAITVMIFPPVSLAMHALVTFVEKTES